MTGPTYPRVEPSERVFICWRFQEVRAVPCHLDPQKYRGHEKCGWFVVRSAG